MSSLGHYSHFVSSVQTSPLNSQHSYLLLSSWWAWHSKHLQTDFLTPPQSCVRTHRHIGTQIGRQAGKQAPHLDISANPWIHVHNVSGTWPFLGTSRIFWTHVMEACGPVSPLSPYLQPLFLVSPSLHLNISQVLEPHTTESQSKSQRPPNGLQGIDKAPLGIPW